MSATDMHPHTAAAASLYDASRDEVLIALRAATQHTLTLNQQLLEYLAQLETPAQMETVVINDKNAGQYVVESRERFEQPVRSIGLLNPNNIPIYFSGIGSAAANMRSPSAPPNSLIVLPISAQMIEVGANPNDLGQNTAVCFLLRYFTVQQAFLGKGA